MLALPRCMLVTDRRRTGGRPLVDVVSAAVRGGVRLVQVREPDLDDDDLTRLVDELRQACGADVMLVLNGRPQLARQLQLGLHLPARLLSSWSAARQRDLALVGCAVHDRRECELARGIVGYWIAGTIYPTASKPGHPGQGLVWIREANKLAAGIPVYAIGGISAARVPEMLRAGAYGVAVSGAILGASRPEEAARELVNETSALRPRPA